MTAIDSRAGTTPYVRAGSSGQASATGGASQLVNGKYQLSARQLEAIHTRSADRGEGGWNIKEPFIGRLKDRVTEGMETFLKENPKATPAEIQKHYELTVEKAGSIESGLLRGIENQMRRIASQYASFIQEAARIWD